MAETARQLMSAEPDEHVAALRRRIAELTDAVAARDAFIAIAAHELRNPITPIMGQLELLLASLGTGQPSPAQLEQRLERLQRACERYLKRATTLLNVSRITSGNVQFEPEPLDLAQLLPELAAGFAEAARQAGVSVTVKVPKNLPGTWDRMAVEQIVENLVSNALKYGGRTPVTLTAEPIGEQVRIKVRDHGSGIPENDRTRVFERFERVVGRGQHSGGFGVGLWIVGQLAGAMGGTVMADDAPGGGALFTVILPMDAKEPRR